MDDAGLAVDDPDTATSCFHAVGMEPRGRMPAEGRRPAGTRTEQSR
ncbi:hypothetical protein [Streptomyces sp. NPDC020917]